MVVQIVHIVAYAEFWLSAKYVTLDSLINLSKRQCLFIFCAPSSKIKCKLINSLAKENE
jgi:hypothetical protein